MNCLINSERPRFLCASHHDQADVFCSNPNCTLRLLCSNCKSTHQHLASEFKSIDCVLENLAQMMASSERKTNKGTTSSQIIQKTIEDHKVLQTRMKSYELTSQNLQERLSEGRNSRSTQNPKQEIEQSLANYLWEQILTEGGLEKTSSLNQDVEKLLTEYTEKLRETKMEIEKNVEKRANQSSKENMKEISRNETHSLNEFLGDLREDMDSKDSKITKYNFESEINKKLDWKRIIQSSSFDEHLQQERKIEEAYYESQMDCQEVLEKIQQNIKMLAEAKNIAISLKANIKYNLGILVALMTETERVLKKEDHFLLKLSEKIKSLQGLNKSKEQLLQKIDSIPDATNEDQLKTLLHEATRLRNSSLEIESECLDKAEERLKFLLSNFNKPIISPKEVQNELMRDKSEAQSQLSGTKKSKKKNINLKSLKNQLKFFWAKDYVWKKSNRASLTSMKKNPGLNSLYLERLYLRTYPNRKIFPRSVSLLARMRSEVHEQEVQLNQLLSHTQDKPHAKIFATFVKKIDSSVIINENVDIKINEVVRKRQSMETELSLLANITFKPATLLEKLKVIQAEIESYPLKSIKFSKINEEIDLFKSICQDFDDIRAGSINSDFKSIEKKIDDFSYKVGNTRYQSTISKLKKELEIIQASGLEAMRARGAHDSQKTKEVIEISSSESEAEIEHDKGNRKKEFVHNDDERLFEILEPALTKKIKDNYGNSPQAIEKVQTESSNDSKNGSRLLDQILKIIQGTEGLSGLIASELKHYASLLSQSVEAIINEDLYKSETYLSAIKIFILQIEDHKNDWDDLKNGVFDSNLLRKILLSIIGKENEQLKTPEPIRTDNNRRSFKNPLNQLINWFGATTHKEI